MNNKGFMMAEVIVVAAIILVAMVGFYASYNKIFSVYNQRIDYYDVVTLYELGDIRKEYKDDIINVFASTDPVIEESNRKVYYVLVDEIVDMANNTELNPTFRDYLTFLSTSLEVDTNSVLVMEKCYDTDNCKYAYLEVFE